MEWLQPLTCDRVPPFEPGIRGSLKWCLLPVCLAWLQSLSNLPPLLWTQPGNRAVMDVPVWGEWSTMHNLLRLPLSSERVRPWGPCLCVRSALSMKILMCNVWDWGMGVMCLLNLISHFLNGMIVLYFIKNLCLFVLFLLMFWIQRSCSYIVKCRASSPSYFVSMFY